MPNFDPVRDQHEQLMQAIHGAAHHVATAITEGFKLMVDVQAQALADLNTAVSGIADAVSTATAALQAALANAGVNDSAAIEAEVTKLNDLAAALKAASAPAQAAPAPTPPAA